MRTPVPAADVTRLCVFMERQSTNDLLLPLLITFLNDRDASLRAAFFDCIMGVCAFVGRASLQAFVLPCILQVLELERNLSSSCLVVYSTSLQNAHRASITQSQHFVVSETLPLGLARLASNRDGFKDVCQIVADHLKHPQLWL